jgi:hypothetical protein
LQDKSPTEANVQKAKFSSVYVLMIFCLFAFGVFFTIMLAANAYQAQNEITTQGQNERILMSYIRTKVRNADTSAAVFVGQYHGLNALGIRENLGGYSFITFIYLYNGWVREIFFEEGYYFELGDSTPIIQVDALRFDRVEHGLIRVMTQEGSKYIFPRSTEGGAF